MQQHAPDIFIDALFEPEYRRHPLVLVDVGARGGLKNNWSSARRHLHLIGFEPDKEEFARLAAAARTGDTTTFFDVALHNRRGPVQFQIARDRGLTSIFEPNREFLDRFPESDRFDTVDRVQIEADTLDSLLRTRRMIDVDFIKADTQGSELFVLEGAADALGSLAVGAEVEVEFTPIYKGQPLFADVDRHLRSLGYLLFDLRPCYWKRSAGRGIGGPRGQMIWADALYLKSLPALQQNLHALPQDRRKSKLLKAISVSLLYGYHDYALEILVNTASVLSPAERRTIERRLRQSGGHPGPLAKFPGRGKLASAFHRLWKLCVQRDEAWSVSRAKLGNLS